MKKKGTILVENIIFISLNLVFLAIIFLFLFSKMGDPAILEERYAKEIALIIDGAKPGMNISVNMADAVKVAKDEKFTGKIVSIDENIVTVRLREKGGYSYSFFKTIDFDFTYFPHSDDETNYFDFKVVEKINKEVNENEEVE